MREKLLKKLKRSARRLLLRRVIESAAVTAAAGGYCSVVIVLAWWFARPPMRVGNMIAAIVFSLLPIIFGAAVISWLDLRRRINLDRFFGMVVAMLCLLCSVIGVAGLVLLRLGWVKIDVLLPAGLAGLIFGAIVGAVSALIRGVSPLQAAVYLDVRGELDERLSTAFEAVQSAEDNAPARMLCRQAMAEADSRNAWKLPVWKRTRVTLGALVMAVFLCYVLVLLPTDRQAEDSRITDLGDLPSALKTMPESRVLHVAETLRLLARVESGMALPEALGRAARAVEKGNPELLAKAIERLEEALADCDEQRRMEILREILSVASGGASNRKGIAARPRRVAPLRSRHKPAAAGGRVRVFDPLYAKVAGNTAAGGDSALPGDGDTHVKLDSAWRMARERAGRNLAARQVSPEYRQIIRNYFATERREDADR